MFRRKMVSSVLVSILLVIVTSFDVLGHCLNGEPGENPDHLISKKRWDAPSGNKVYYYIDRTELPGMPSLYTDVTWASTQWSRVQFNNQTVNFELSYAERIPRSPGYKDYWNVVGWGTIEENPVAVAATRRWYSVTNQRRLIEVDTIFNYYQPYRAHGQTEPGKICLRDVATHEFGHWVELWE